MRVIIQRSREAKVSIDGEVVGQIPSGFVLLVGFTDDDTKEDLEYVANKVSKLRVFEDENGKMNLSIDQVGGDILSISQFTLYGNTKKGNRPSFIKAADPEYATQLYLEFNEMLRSLGHKVEEGVFGADMQVSLVNDGPITITIDSKNKDL